MTRCPILRLQQTSLPFRRLQQPPATLPPPPEASVFPSAALGLQLPPPFLCDCHSATFSGQLQAPSTFGSISWPFLCLSPSSSVTSKSPSTSNSTSGPSSVLSHFLQQPASHLPLRQNLQVPSLLSDNFPTTYKPPSTSDSSF